MLCDVNAFLGSWPFSIVPEYSAPQLADYLAQSGIRRAVVSHLGAVFQPDPMLANRKLLAAVRRTPALAPLPIVNPLLANWREQLTELGANAAVRAVRILPNYHNYALKSRRLDPFMDALAEAKLKLVLTARLEDERHRYFALRVKGVPCKAIAAFLARFPDHHILCTGVPLFDIQNLAEKHANFSSDLSYAENITMMEMLRDKIAPSRLMFGTFAPLVSARAQAAKLTQSPLTAQERKLIYAENARRFFSL
ncbi:MAG: hypothetical protein HZA31_05805 [Opitutae bacterium]|nr:hypothetical protein [Opitutae bacterium]